MIEHSYPALITPKTQPSAPLEAHDEALRTLYIQAGAYDQPFVFLSGRWCIRAQEPAEGLPTEGAPLQWRGVAIYVAQGATLELVGLSIHARLDADTRGRPFEDDHGLEERAGGVVCLGSLTARGCSLSTSGGHALSALGGAQIRLEETRLHHAGRCGLYVDAAQGSRPAHVSCDQSRFEWNGADQVAHQAESSSDEEHETDGVWLSGALEAAFTRCHFLDNRGDGVYAKAGSVTLEGCLFERNEVNGAYAGARATLDARGCVWRDSREAAAGVKGGTLVLTDGQMLGGEGLGVFALDGAKLRVERSLLSAHKGGGVLVIEAQGAHVYLSETECRDNGQLGVVLERAQGVQLTKLEVNGSTQAQLYAVGSTLSCEEVTLVGGQLGFVAEGSCSECRALVIRESHDVACLLKPLEPKEEVDSQASLEGALGSHLIEGLQLTQRGGVGLLASGPLTITLVDATWIGSDEEPPQELISLDRVRAVTLTRCQLSGGEVGLRSRGTHVQMVDSEVAQVRLTSIVAREASSLELAGCQLMGREGAAGEQRTGPMVYTGDLDVDRSRAGAGLWCHGSKLKMTQTRLSDHRGSQLVLLGGSEGQCQGCVIEGGRDAGVLIAEAARLTITHSVITGQRGTGVWLEREGRLEAQALEVHHQQSGGVFVRDESRATFVSCTLHHQVKASVMCDAGSAVSLDDCVLSSGQDTGLLIERGAQAVVRRTKLMDYALVGVAVDDAAQLQLESSEIRGGDVGVLCFAGSQGEVTGNWIYDQKKAALLVYERSTVEVDDNTHLSLEELLNEQH